MVKILRTTGGKNRTVQNHTVDYCGTWKTKGWGRGGWEGGSVVSSSLTPGQDTVDRDLGALEATPEQHGLRGARRVGDTEPLTLLGNLSTPRPRTEEILLHGREGETHTHIITISQALCLAQCLAHDTDLVRVA